MSKLPQFNTIKDAPVKDDARKNYTPDNAKARVPQAKNEVNDAARGKDKVYGIESRARWGAADSDALAEQLNDASAIERGDAAAPAKASKKTP